MILYSAPPTWTTGRYFYPPHPPPAQGCGRAVEELGERTPTPQHHLPSLPWSDAAPEDQEKGQGQPLLREAVTQPQSPADSVKGPEQIRAAHLLYNPHPLPRTPPASSPKREGRAGPKLIQPAQSRASSQGLGDKEARVLRFCAPSQLAEDGGWGETALYHALPSAHSLWYSTQFF